MGRFDPSVLRDGSRYSLPFHWGKLPHRAYNGRPRTVTITKKGGRSWQKR